MAADPPHPLEHHASDLVARIGSPLVKPDLYEAMVECASSICADAAEAAASWSAARRRCATPAPRWPAPGCTRWRVRRRRARASDPRYDHIHATMRGLVERTPTCALHVHVGMPDAETAIAVCNRLRAHLPLLQALAAHSPYWHGRDSGFATARAQLFRGFPRAVIPRAVRGLGRLRDDRGRLGRGRRAARLHVPVVGHPAAPAARHRRGARDGRPVAAGHRRRPGRARARPGRRVRRRPRRRRARPRRSPSHRSVPAATGSTRRSGGAAACGPCTRWPPRCSRWRGRTPRLGGATRSRRSSASCATATAPTACATRTRPAGCPRCSSGSCAEAAEPLYGYTSHDVAHPHPAVDRPRVRDRHAQAAVAGVVGRHRGVAVDRVAADEVARVHHPLGVRPR